MLDKYRTQGAGVGPGALTASTTAEWPIALSVTYILHKSVSANVSCVRYLHIIVSSTSPSAVGKAYTDSSTVSSMAKSMLVGLSMNVLIGAAAAFPA